MSKMKQWLEAQLQVEYQAKLKVEGAITALEATLRALKSEEACSGSGDTDQQSPAVQETPPSDTLPVSAESDDLEYAIHDGVTEP